MLTQCAEILKHSPTKKEGNRWKESCVNASLVNQYIATPSQNLWGSVCVVILACAHC